MRSLWKLGLFSIIGFGLMACAEANKEKAAEALGVQQEDGSVLIKLSALDIEVREATQNAEKTHVNFKLVVSVDNDLCDLVDAQATYSLTYEISHSNADLAGKSFQFTADLGRIKRGNTKETEVQRLTNGPVAFDSIHVTQFKVRDLQNCTIDPFR